MDGLRRNSPTAGRTSGPGYLSARIIEEPKLRLFRENILQPQERRNERPEIYDNTGWQHDVDPIYVLLAMPDAPVLGLPRMTRREAYERAESALCRFFLRDSVRPVITKLAEVILERRFLRGEEAIRLVSETHILDEMALRELLQ